MASGAKQKLTWVLTWDTETQELAENENFGVTLADGCALGERKRSECGQGRKNVRAFLEGWGRDQALLTVLNLGS